MSENDDFLLVDVDTANSAMEAAKNNTKKNKKSSDIWLLPTIKNTSKAYDAMIRLLPRGVNGLKNKLHPTVPNAVHYVKDAHLNLFTTIPCRKSLGPNEFCPYCEKQRKNFFQFKNAGDMEMQKKWDARQANTTHIGNFYVRQDLVNHANDATVKLWEHTKAINTKLLDPLKPEDPNAVAGFKKKVRFNPYSPINGRDFILEVRPSTKNPDWPSYDGSSWDEVGSDLAPSKDEIIAILDKCHDLQQFIDAVPTVEQIVHMMQEYDEKVDAAERQRNSGSTSSNFNSRQIYNPATESVASASEFLGQPQATAPVTQKAQPIQAPSASVQPSAPVAKIADVFDLNESESNTDSDVDDLPF